MRTGYFGSVQESDPSEARLRTLHRIRQHADAASEVRNRKGTRQPGWLTHSILNGRAISRCLCVIKLAGSSPATRQRIFAAENLNWAIVSGLDWALNLKLRSKGTRDVAEIYMTHLLAGDKSDTLTGRPCFVWKPVGRTIEQELDRILADILNLKMREIEELVDRLVAGRFLAKLESLENALRKIGKEKRPVP